MCPRKGAIPHGALTPHPVRLSHVVANVGKDREVQLELVAERGLARLIIRAHPPDDRARRVQLPFCIAKLAGLNRAPWGVVLWIEVENEPTASDRAE